MELKHKEITGRVIGAAIEVHRAIGVADRRGLVEVCQRALRIFLDGCMLEAFANDRQCVTQMIFPTRADSLQVKVAVFGQEAVIHSVDAWDMAPITVDDRRGK